MYQERNAIMPNELANYGSIGNKLLDKILRLLNFFNDPHGLRDMLLEQIDNNITRMTFDRDPMDNIAILTKIYDNRKSKNLFDVFEAALPLINEDSDPEKVDDNWFMDFMDKASKIVTENFKLLWGKVLAEKINSPDKISKRLLHNLFLMSEQDAENFLNLTRFCFHDENHVIQPLIFIKNHQIPYANSRITTKMLKELEQYSLIETNYDAGFAFYNKKRLFYGKHKITLYGDRIPAGNVRLTTDGEELFNLVDRRYNDQILEYVINIYQYRNIDIKTSIVKNL